MSNIRTRIVPQSDLSTYSTRRKLVNSLPQLPVQPSVNFGFLAKSSSTMSSPQNPASAVGSGISLADRMSRPDTTETQSTGMNTATQGFQPASGRSWSDKLNSPVSANPHSTLPGPSTNSIAQETTSSNLSQVDGATEPFMGSQLQESGYEVEVKLVDLQADPNSPLYSVKSFEQLGL